MSSKYKFADNDNPDSYREYFVSFAVTFLQRTDTHTHEAMLHICASVEINQAWIGLPTCKKHTGLQPRRMQCWQSSIPFDND